MMENTDDFIFFKDRHHVITGASQSTVAFCASAEHWTDLIGLTDYDIFPESLADIYYELEKQVFAGVRVAHEIQETLTRDDRRGFTAKVCLAAAAVVHLRGGSPIPTWKLMIGMHAQKWCVQRR